jgi:hypothetical protein
VADPPPLVDAFARLLDDAEPDQLIASSVQLRALLDERISQVSER